MGKISIIYSKMIRKLIFTIILAIALLSLFIYYGGGKKVKKAARETYEVGKDLEKLEDKLKKKEKNIKRKIKELKEEFDGEDTKK